MDYDETAPVLANVVDPDSEVAFLRPMSMNVAGTITATIKGPRKAVEVEGGSVLRMDESGKNHGLAMNFLATKIAPDDTINGRALAAGETNHVSADVSSATLAALKPLGIEIQPG